MHETLKGNRVRFLALLLSAALAWPVGGAKAERPLPYDRIYTQKAPPQPIVRKTAKSAQARRVYRREELSIPQIWRDRLWSAPARARSLPARGFALATCPPGVPAGAVCLRPAGRYDGDAFVRALIESPNAETVPILKSLGIPVIEDVPPIVIINPD
jgi:hypothetical protein